MKAQQEFEYIVALIQEYLEKMPQATRLAVSNHTQQCVNVVVSALTEEPAALPTTGLDPQ